MPKSLCSKRESLSLEHRRCVFLCEIPTWQDLVRVVPPSTYHLSEQAMVPYPGTDRTTRILLEVTEHVRAIEVSLPLSHGPTSYLFLSYGHLSLQLPLTLVFHPSLTLSSSLRGKSPGRPCSGRRPPCLHPTWTLVVRTDCYFTLTSLE
jgi:hypothetical protein